MNVTIENIGDKWIARVEGRLDTASAAAFAEGIKPLIDNADKTIYLDCKKLEYISSSGLRQFLSLRKVVGSQNGKMIIANLNSGLKDIFKMTGFTSLFDFE